DEAELWLAQKLQERAPGQERERPARVTFEEAAEAWYRDRGHDKGWAPSTRRDYRSALDVHLLPFFGPKRLDQITPTLIESWRRREMTPYLDEKGVTRVRLPTRTAQKCLAMLHGIFQHSRRAHGLGRNPAAHRGHIQHD